MNGFENVVDVGARKGYAVVGRIQAFHALNEGGQCNAGGCRCKGRVLSGRTNEFLRRCEHNGLEIFVLQRRPGMIKVQEDQSKRRMVVAIVSTDRRC